MKIRTIVELLNGKVTCGEERLDDDFEYAFASDLMSDILTLGDDNPVIKTGLWTVQTKRTCEMGSLDVIVFVRKKKPTPEMIELAKDNDMVIIECSYSMFKTNGILYNNGMMPIY